MMFREHQMVRTNKILEYEGSGVPRYSEGTIVHIYNNGEAYEVEFPIHDSYPILMTIKPEDIERI